MRIGSIPIRVNPSFWFLSLFIAWANSQTILEYFLWFIVVFVSVLGHELGHAATSLAYGKRAAIELGLLGGVTTMRGATLSRAREFLIVFMGPFCGLLMALAAYAFLQAVPTSFFPLRLFLLMMFWANLFWTVLNVLPVHPLDGGKLVAIGLESLLGPSGLRASYFVGGVFSIICTVLFLSINAIIGAALFLLFCFENFRVWAQSKRSTPDEEAIWKEIYLAQADWQAGDTQKAIQRLEGVCRSKKQGEAPLQVLEYLASYLIASHQVAEAYEMLLPYQRKLKGKALRDLQLASFQLGHWEESLKAGERASRERGDPAISLLNAMAAAHLDQEKTAVNWLHAAMAEGAIDMEAVLASPDFNTIRTRPLFQAFVEHAGDAAIGG